MKSELGTLNSADFKKSVISAIIIGALLPIAIAIQTPGFDLFTADWRQILVIAFNGAIVGFTGEIMRRLGTDSDNKFMGAV